MLTTCLGKTFCFNWISQLQLLLCMWVSKIKTLLINYCFFRASFYGGLIVLLQTSPESANIYRLFQRINVAQPTEELKSSVVGKDGVTEEDFLSYLGNAIFLLTISFTICSQVQMLSHFSSIWVGCVRQYGQLLRIWWHKNCSWFTARAPWSNC